MADGAGLVEPLEVCFEVDHAGVRSGLNIGTDARMGSVVFGKRARGSRPT